MLSRLTSIFRRSKLYNCKENELTHLLVIDFFEFTRGGHFGYWMCWFCKEFSARFNKVAAVVPDPIALKKLFADMDSKYPNSLEFAALKKSHAKTFNLDRLVHDLGIHKGNKVCIFIMWGYDLEGFKQIRVSSYPWATLIGISWLHRGSIEANAERERRLLEIMQQDAACKAFLQPDAYLQGKHEQSIWIPDLENVETLGARTPLLDQIIAHKGEKLCIGVFGMLSGSRCLNALLQLANAQPELRFVAAGKVMIDSVRDDLKPLLEPGRLPNLMVHANFIDDEMELNAAIELVDGILIDSANYPVQSGIVIKAMKLGTWILSTDGNSWTNDVIKEYEIGYTFRDFNECICMAHDSWLSTDGPQNSRETFIAISNQNSVDRCFDALTNRLLSS